MKSLFRTVPAFLLLFGLLPLVVSAQSGTPDLSQNEIIDRIIHETGISDGIESSPREIRRQFASNPFGLEAEKNERMIQLFEEAYDDGLLQQVQQTFSEQYQAEHAGQVMTWLEDSTAQQVLNSEKEFYTLQGTRKQIVRRYEMEQEPPSEQRTQLVDSLIEATSAVESAVESQVILFRSIISAFSILSDQQNFSESQIDGIVSNYRMQVEPQMQQEMSRQLLIMYYDIDSEILRDYTSFYQSEAGRWLNTTSSQAIQEAYRTAGEQFVQTVKESTGD